MFLLGCSLVACAPSTEAAKPYLAVLGPPPIRFSKAPEIPVIEPDPVEEESDSNIDIVPADGAGGTSEGTGLTSSGALIGDVGMTGYSNAVSGGPRSWIEQTSPISMEGMGVAIDPNTAGMSPIAAQQQRVEEDIHSVFAPENGPVVPRVYIPLTPQMFVPPNSVTSPGSSAAYRVVPR